MNSEQSHYGQALKNAFPVNSADSHLSDELHRLIERLGQVDADQSQDQASPTWRSNSS